MEKKIKWEYHWARKFSASRFEVVMRVFFSDFYRQEFGVEMGNTLIAPVYKNHAIYHDPDEWDAFERKVYIKAAHSLSAFSRYKKMIVRNQERFLKVCTQIAGEDLENASLEQHSEWYEEYMSACQDFFNAAIWIPFIIEPLICSDVKDELEKIVKEHNSTGQFQELFDAIFVPEKKNAIMQEREEMLRIVQGVREKQMTETDTQTQLQAHAKKFRWIPCYDIMDSPWSESDFAQSFKETLEDDVREELRQFQDFSKRKERFTAALAAFNKMGCTEEQRTLFTIAHDIAYIKDERDDFRRQGSYLIQPLFISIGKLMGGLPLREVANLLSDEVRDFFKTQQLPSEEKIQERVNGYVLLRKDGEPDIHIYSGAEVKKIMKSELSHLKMTTGTEVSGTVGSAGIATGPARLVITKHDLRKVMDGDIMVAVTTHPDFVPAMRRCAAIVTDEGGITSHAAIVSRELGIPCVVGTQQATSTFVDGDKMKVDAVRGKVRIQ
ncbi:MAG: PEP-utilizing enzyme [Candidatus Kerfeldbacteria bacterium]